MLRILFTALLFPSLLLSTELKPWTERDLELYPSLNFRYQHFDASDDLFYTLGLSGSYAAWSAEIEVEFADTSHRHFGFDQLRLTGKYLLLTDDIGDPFALSTGVTLVKASKIALKDISSFHHGRNEIEWFISMGKQEICWERWISRWWGVLVAGVADHGSPWFRGGVSWEKNFSERFRLQLFAHCLHGLGGQSLDLESSFHGYGPIAHRSVDIGVNLSMYSNCYGIFGGGFIQRVYAHHFPKYAQQYIINYKYPFGL